jgi:hypothetical protein
MAVDDISPPGAWKDELDRMPWRYSQQVRIDNALAALRQSGFQTEASLLAQEINVLKAEIEHLRKGK